MINFSKIRGKNFLSIGNYWSEFDLSQDHMTLLRGKNGEGKCVSGLSSVKLKNKITGEIIETTIGDFYDTQKKQINREQDSRLS